MKCHRFSYFHLCLYALVVSLPFCTSDTKTPTTSEAADAVNQTATANNTNQPTDNADKITSHTLQSGKWEAIISNGYKGDKLTFTVSADGKRVENVEFTGHWRSRSSRTEVLMNLDPPNPFEISNSSFSAVQQEEKAGMWWEFIGHFTSPTSAEGSYRCSFAGGENDTYKLKWTAKPL